MRTGRNEFLYGCAGLLAMTVWGGAHAHGPHEHGFAELTVVADGDAVRIELSTPAANLFGFERAPADVREESLMRDGFAALGQGANLFAPATRARCAFGEVAVLSSLLSSGEEEDADSSEAGADDDHDHEHGDEHADVFVAWTLSCEAPGELRALDAGGLFRRFPGIERLRVHVAAAQGQTAATLSAHSSVVRF